MNEHVSISLRQKTHDPEVTLVIINIKGELEKGWKYKKAYYNADIILQFPINSCKNDILKSFIDRWYYSI